MALTFNGSSSKLTMPSPGLAGYPLTLFCWIKPSSAVASQMVFGGGDFGGMHEMLIFAAGGDPGSKVKAFTKDSLASSFAASTTAISTAGWLPAMAVYSNTGDRTIYYGAGASVKTTDVLGADPTLFDRLVVGCRGITDTLWFNGDIAHPTIWSAALDQTDFNALAAGAVPSTVKNANLYEYWAFASNGATQTGVNGKVLTAFNTALASSDPLTGSSASVSGAGGIASLEGFGTPVVTSNGAASIVGAGAIPSAEAFGAPSVTSNSPVSIIGAGGIATAEAFGLPSVSSNAPATAVQIIADGIWTWYTDPRAVWRNGWCYVMAVDSVGTCRIHRYNPTTGVTESATLSSVGLEIDDHNNGSILFLPSGRIVAFYGLHNDPIIRYKVSNVAESVLDGWSAEQQRGGGEGDYSYPTPYILSQDPSKQYIFNRRWTNGTGATRALSFRTSPDLGTVPATLSAYNDVIVEANARPYVKSVSDGVKRIHVCASSAHPNEATFISINHFYMELDGSNVMRYYTTAGVEITTLPMPISAMTRVDDGTNLKRWNSDIAIDSNGYPRILWMRYPNNNGTDIRYMYSRWNGSAWTTQELGAAGAGLYSAEQYYHPGLCFDSQDANKIYMSFPDAGVLQIQEWRSTDGGATMAKYRDITTGTPAGSNRRLRPYSPRGHNGVVPVLWFEGRYTTFSDYNTAVYALRESVDTVSLVSGAGGITSGEAFGLPAVASSGGTVATVSGAGGIVTGESFGNANVTVFGADVAVVTAAGGVASSEVFGVPLFSRIGPVLVSGAGGIASGDAIGVPTVSAINDNAPQVFGSLVGTRFPSSFPRRPASV